MKIINAIPGFGQLLSEKEIKEFLENSKLNLQLGTTDEKGEPNIHPVWYNYENDKIYIVTPKKSKKAKNALAQKTVYFSVDDENFPYKGVKGKGRIKANDDLNFDLQMAEKIITKYMGSKDNDIGKWILSEIQQGNEYVLEINPKFFTAWSFQPPS